MGIDELQTAVGGEIRGVRRFAVPFEIARRGQGQDRRLDQLARDERREAGLAESDGEVDAVGNQIADMLARHELDGEFGVELAEAAEAAPEATAAASSMALRWGFTSS